MHETRRGGLAAVHLFSRDGFRITVLWVVLGSILAEFATRVGDYIDFDAGRYERLAITIARTHSLVPRVNGVNIHSYSQLYPILIAPFLAHGFISTDMRNIGVESSYIMSSACIPAFFLARRVTTNRWVPYVVAALTVCMPWIVTAPFMMTEIAAYPACTLAVLAMVVSLVEPSNKHDLLALAALGLAFFARGELVGLAIVFPVALIAFELGRAPAGGVGRRIATGGRSLVRSHIVLTALYGVGGVVVIGLYVSSRLSSVIGIYGVYSDSAHLAFSRLPRSLVEHLATFSLGVGVVPLVIALAWLWANVVRPSKSAPVHAFACVGGVMSIVLFVQATNFDLVVNAYVHDRFLMYFVPVVLVAVAAALADERKPRWSLVAPLALVSAGFAFGDIPRVTWQQFTWLDLDTPISTVYRVFAFHFGGLTPVRAGLVAFVVVGTGLFVICARRFSQRPVSVGVLAFTAVAMLFATGVVFQRTFGSLDRNSRPVTASAHGTLDWIDGAIGPNGSATVIPYPISSDWFVSEERWVDFEFFNKSIQRVARLPNLDPFDYLGLWFPKLDLHMNPKTGVVAESPTRWVVESGKETRFRIAGLATLNAQDATLIDAGKAWRLAWRTFGLYDDGWTRPGVPMRMRIYSRPGQQHAEIRNVALVLRAPLGVSRPLTIDEQGKIVHVAVTENDSTQIVPVCVPAHGNAELRFRVKGSSAIPGDLASYGESQLARNGGIFVASLSEADEIGGACTPPAS